MIPTSHFLCKLGGRLAAATLFLAVLAPGLRTAGAPGRKLAGQRASARAAAAPQAIAATAPQLATLVNLHIFSAQLGADPNSGLAIDSTGNIYGTTMEGGANNCGTVFRVSSAGTITVLYSFGSSVNSLDVSGDGDEPQGGILLAPDGLLYGTTADGGASNAGTLFRLDPATGALTTLANFDYPTVGADSAFTLVTDGSGNFYGTTGDGGAEGDGTIFVYNTTAGTLTALAPLDYTEEEVSGPLLLAPDGNLYGVDRYGGVNEYGSVFQFNPATFVFTDLLDFDDSTNGAYPGGLLVTDGSGDFYGSTNEGGTGDDGGTVYELSVDDTANPPSATPTVLYTFTNYENVDGLLSGSDGNLYGTTAYGGDDDNGTVFQLIPNTPDGNGNAATVNTVYSFTGESDGYDPFSTLVTNSAGDLIGLSNNNFGTGTIFELDPTAGTTPLQYTFGAADIFPEADGLGPAAALTLGSDGNFYGTTEYGGQPGEGTVFVYSPKTGLTTTIYTFYGANQLVDGGQPLGQLVEASPGIFYGTTAGGGTYYDGTVFRLSTSTNQATGAITGTVTLLYSFGTSVTDGYSPAAGLVLSPANGIYYGTTTYGGANSCGTIFQFNPASGAVGTVASFNGTNGEYPVAGLLALGNTLYGTTSDGGAESNGAIFAFTPATGVLTPLFSFAEFVSGADPTGPLIQGLDGYLYGTTRAGGQSDDGTIFQLNLANDTLTTLVNFNYDNGSVPEGALVQAADGNFYGTTSQGGPGGPLGSGTIFQFNPITGAFNTLVNFGKAEGIGPFPGLTIGANGNFYGVTTGSDDREYLANLNKVSAKAKTRGATKVPATATRGGRLPAATGARSAKMTSTMRGRSLQARAVAQARSQAASQSAGPDTVAGGSDTDDFEGSIFELIVAPAITSSNVAVGTVGTAFNAQVTGSFNPTSFLASGLPPGLTINPGTGAITGTPTSAGTFAVAVAVGNAAGTSTQTLSIVIQPVPASRVPAITSAAPPAGDTGVAYGYAITASNTPTSYGAVGLPPGLSVNTGTGFISGTPTTAGAYAVTFSATNAAGTTSAGFSLTILPPAPVINSPLVDGAQIGQAYSYQITASNIPSSFAASGLPPGLSINPATGLISGSPTVTGAYLVGLSASNGEGTGQATLSLEVTAMEIPAPVVSSALTAAGQVAVAFDYQIAATNNPSSFAATGLPAGLSVNSKTGLISGTPTVAGEFPVTLQATNGTGTGSAALKLTIAKEVLPKITVAANVPDVTIGTGMFGEFQLTRTGDLTKPLLVHYTVVGTAIPKTDYTPLKGTKKFVPGESSVEIKVFPKGDLGNEPMKTVKLVLQRAEDYTLGKKAKAIVTILPAP